MPSLCGQINEMRHKSHINMVVYIWVYLQSMMKLIYSLKNVKYTNRYIRNKLSTSTQTRIFFNYRTVVIYKIFGFQTSYK